MYINNIWLVYYLIIGLVGLMIGKIAAWSNTVYVEEGTLTFRDFWKNRKQVFKMQYILMFIIAFLYILLLYFTGLPNNLVKTLNLVKFMLLIPMLVSSFLIDFKHRIIPNRLNMTMFEIGLIFTFIYGTFNISIARDMRMFNWWRNIFSYYSYRRLNCWKRSNGTWRRQIYGGNRLIFWRYSNWRS